MGHSSTRAALICLHSTGDRQRTLADALGGLARAELAKDKGKATRSAGGVLARKWHGAGRRRASRTGRDRGAAP
jgi:hypothetical protein